MQSVGGFAASTMTPQKSFRVTHTLNFEKSPHLGLGMCAAV